MQLEFFCDRTFEEANDCADNGKYAAKDRPDAECYVKVFHEFRLRFAHTDGRVSRKGEQENRTDDEASRRKDLGDQSVVRDDCKQTSYQGKEESEQRHKVKIQNRGRNGKRSAAERFFVAEYELAARIRVRSFCDCEIRRIRNGFQEHHAAGENAEQKRNAACNIISVFRFFCHNKPPEWQVIVVLILSHNYQKSNTLR